METNLLLKTVIMLMLIITHFHAFNLQLLRYDDPFYSCDSCMRVFTYSVHKNVHIVFCLEKRIRTKYSTVLSIVR